MLQAVEVSKIFRRSGSEISAVRDVSLSLEPNRITAVVGRSGSGKSTLLHLLAGLLTPSSGTVTFHGQDLYQQSDTELSRLRNQKIGVIPQSQAGLPYLTVLENVLLPLGIVPGNENDSRRAKELLEYVGISKLADTKLAALSGGELRRAAAARAMIRQPEVILADEPTSDLDQENTAIIISLLRKAAAAGAAVLLVTHELDTLQNADAIFRMESGALRRDG